MLNYVNKKLCFCHGYVCINQRVLLGSQTKIKEQGTQQLPKCVSKLATFLTASRGCKKKCDFIRKSTLRLPWCDLRKHFPDEFMVSLTSFKSHWIEHGVDVVKYEPPDSETDNKAGYDLMCGYLDKFLCYEHCPVLTADSLKEKRAILSSRRHNKVPFVVCFHFSVFTCCIYVIYFKSYRFYRLTTKKMFCYKFTCCSL